MSRVLGKNIGKAFLDILENLKVASIAVQHCRPTAPHSLKHGDYLPESDRVPMTGRELEDNHREFAIGKPGRRRWCLNGGVTRVALRIGDREYAGDAVCSREDRFIAAEGRRIALTRAILAASGGEGRHVHTIRALLAANGIFVDELLVQGAQILGGQTGRGKTSQPLRDFFETVRRVSEGGGGGSLADFLRTQPRPPAWASSVLEGGSQLLSATPGRLGRAFETDNLMPKPHVLLEVKALRKLRQAEVLDAKAFEEGVGKKERRELLRKAKVLREQAAAAVAVACQIKPDPEDQEDKAPVSATPARNEG